MVLGCRTPMMVFLVKYATLLAIVSIVNLLSSNIFYFPRRCHWIQFLLFVFDEVERFIGQGCLLLW